MRRRTREALASLAAIGILIGLLGVVDPRVRDLTSGDGARGAAHRALGRSHTAVSTGWDSVKDLAAERAPMATFVVVGAALFVLMFRT